MGAIADRLSSATDILLMLLYKNRRDQHVQGHYRRGLMLRLYVPRQKRFKIGGRRGVWKALVQVGEVRKRVNTVRGR